MHLFIPESNLSTSWLVLSSLKHTRNLSVAHDIRSCPNQKRFANLRKTNFSRPSSWVSTPCPVDLRPTTRPLKFNSGPMRWHTRHSCAFGVHGDPERISSCQVSSTSPTSYEKNLSEESLIKQQQFLDRVPLSIERRRRAMQAANKCTTCFLFKTMCVCDRYYRLVRKDETKSETVAAAVANVQISEGTLEKTSTDTQKTLLIQDSRQDKSPFEVSLNPFTDSACRLKFHIAIFMHFLEWGRSSNSGKLVPLALPENSTIYLYGIQEDHKALLDRARKGPTFLLYPKQSAPILEALEEVTGWDSGSCSGSVSGAGLEASQSQSLSVEETQQRYTTTTEITLIVLDSTWNQSKTMNRFIPRHIPRVNIDRYVEKPSEYLIRKQQGEAGRVSTLEAVVFAISAISEKMSVQEQALIKTATSRLKLAFHINTDMVLQQSGRFSAYGHEKAVVMQGPLRTVVRPDKCPNCGCSEEKTGLTVKRTIFENWGVRKNSLELGTINNKDDYVGQVRLWKCKACDDYFRIRIEEEAPSVGEE